MRSHLLRLLVVILLAGGLVPVGDLRAYAVPVTVGEVLEDLPVSDEGPPDDLDWHADEHVAADVDALSIPSDVSTSAAVPTPLPFSLVGFKTAAETEHVAFRTSEDGAAWTNWQVLDVDHAGEEGPDPGSPEAAAAAGWTEPVWVGDASHLQVAVHGGDVSDVQASVVDSSGLSGAGTRTVYDTGPSPADAYMGAPPVVTRAQWGADERLNNGSPAYAGNAYLAVVHHTAGSNSYGRSDVPAILRGIHYFHTQSRGWDDIGYNFLVDRFGTVYEGRAGGVTRAVVGAHASGFNTGSFGVSVMGNFVTSPVPSVVVDSLVAVIAWKFRVHQINPYNNTSAVGGRSLPRIVGHGDVGLTSCPGGIASQMSTIRGRAAAAANPFDDVNGGNTHWRHIFELYYALMLDGCADRRYCPETAVTRAQTATMLVKALELPPQSGQAFPDVPAGSTHAGAVNALAARDIITGYDDGRFHPDERLTRAQMASIITRAVGIAPSGTATFSDVQRDDVHLGAINALARSGITAGCDDGRFCPRQAVPRDQMASFVYSSRAYWVTNRGS